MKRFCILLFVIALSSVAFAQSDIPSAVGVATDEGIEFPAEIPSGLIALTFENNRSEAPFGPILARLNDDVTLDDFFVAMGSENPMEGVFLVTLYGGSNILPGESLTFTSNLAAGEYVMVEFEGDAMPITFTVTESGSDEMLEKPESDISLAMVDFAFGVPSHIPAGEHIWHLQNYGEQWHEVAIFPVEEGTTTQDMREMMMSMPMEGEGESSESEEDSGDELAFFWAPMSGDTEAWVSVDLEPGTYGITCFLPDLNGDFSPHVAHGMLQVFVVEEAE